MPSSVVDVTPVLHKISRAKSNINPKPFIVSPYCILHVADIFGDHSSVRLEPPKMNDARSEIDFYVGSDSKAFYVIIILCYVVSKLIF